ncbi:hypothetical protein ASG37_02480 [Sphingomonas sp. Leaf407]|uniref:hypothetical protein n=1 Tax=unclassified Sphingomonas TaxID=196159 RepID=UPI0006F60202|nr:MULTISPECIES: hypothetical protein [unclassified Sphingomonas]KQN40670.1 hypothetical protein ASE97_02505 [Sphingomonas sp. Leaf42]KQT30026.1 hypothetical protein ASG37_02480 [Sphingomonas sp. Leaf407]
MRARLLTEIVAAVAGLAAAWAIGSLSAWSYPLGRRDIWLVTWVSMAVVALLGMRQVQRAIAEERAKGADRDG